jgi:hypothetical protein
MLVMFWVGVAAAVSLVYLAHRHQRWLAQPLPSRWAHAAAGGLGLGAGVCGGLSLGWGTALLCALVGAMVCAGAWPLLSLLRPRPAGEAPLRGR